MSILESSKILMHEFHYDYFKNEYDKKSELLFTDTNSLMYEKTKDVYEKKSNYSDHSNKLVIEKFGGFASK